MKMAKKVWELDRKEVNNFSFLKNKPTNQKKWRGKNITIKIQNVEIYMKVLR